MRKGNVNNKSILNEQVQHTLEDKIDLAQSMDVISEEKTIEPNLNVENIKSKDRLKIIILIVITVLCISVTAIMLIYKYLNTSRTQQGVNENNNNNNNNIQVETKKETEDTKYLVSFKDMYTINPITKIDKEYESKATKKQGSMNISYIEISGLQNKELENKINKEIKDNAYFYSDKITAKQSYHSYTDIQGNFSNILSVHTYVYVYEDEEMVYDEEINLNYNLATGEKIHFLDLFASNTPINSIIYNLEYERLAWDTEYNLDMSEKEWQNAMNMDKRDTSEYEDMILKVINRFKNLDKDEISFSITPNRINVNLNVGDNGEQVSYSIRLYEYIDYVTLYKRFLTDDVVYENLPSNKLLVFNDMVGYVPEYYKIESDNLFISVISYNSSDYMMEEEKELAKTYSQQAVDKKNQLMKQHTENILNEVRSLAKNNKNKGYMARFMPYSYIDKYENDYGGEALIYISLDGAIEEMKIDYYKENAFRLLAKHNVRPRASVDDILIGQLDYDNKNIKSLLYNEGSENVVDLWGYYTLDGVLVAKTYEEVEKYLNNKYTEPEPEPEVLPEQVTQQPEVEIYEEE